MERACVACGGTGREEQVDPTLPPPPCRVCHPDAAERHMRLARATLHVAAPRRFAAYLLLRDAGRLPVPVGR